MAWRGDITGLPTGVWRVSPPFPSAAGSANAFRAQLGAFRNLQGKARCVSVKQAFEGGAGVRLRALTGARAGTLTQQ